MRAKFTTGSLRLAAAQHQPIRKMPPHLDPFQARLLGQALQLAWPKAAPDRERAVFADQPVVQKQSADGRVKIIGHRMTMQIDHEDAPPGHARELAQDANNIFVAEVMRKERTEHKIERIRRERQTKSIAAHRRDLFKAARLFKDRPR